MPIAFTDNSTGQPSSWFWNFGNGDTSVVQNPLYTYKAAGNYTVKLRVTKGAIADSVVSVITVYDTASAMFTYTYTDICSAPAAISFAAASPQSNTQYSWNFGDGNKGLTATATHNFTTARHYTVTLIATTDKGCRSTTSKEIQVGKGDAVFSAAPFACTGQPAIFANASVPLPRASTWTIDGNTTFNTQDLAYTFTTPGTHTVRLTANFGTCTDVTEKNITVNATPKAGFAASGTLQSCSYPQTVTFTNNSSGTTACYWVFGDGETATSANPVHTYKTAGSFSVSLIAYNANGCSDTLKKDALVQLGPPVIRGFTGLPASGCIPRVVNFKADIVSGDPVATYDWDFGDGSPHSTVAEPSYTYTKEGYYRVTLNVKTVSGCTGNYSLFQAIAAGTPPAGVDFKADKTDICAFDSVLFKGTVAGTVTSWTWEFGDGTKTSGHDTAVHRFQQPGDYTITYYLSNKGCSAPPVQKKSYIHVRPPVARFKPTYYCDDQLKVSFSDQSIQPQSWKWDFGDNQEATAQSPTNTYGKSGRYTVSLTTTNAGCSYTVTDTITVVGYKPAFAYTPGNATICRNTEISATINDPSFINDYTWYMGDGTKLYSDTSVTYTYTKSGTYTPWLMVQYLNGCYDTIYNAKPVTVYGAAASFDNALSKTCLYAATVFTDKSSTDGTHAIKTWLWEYGDGKSDLYTAAPFKHVYETAGPYNVRLTTTDAYGCTDTARNTVVVQQEGAKADFNYAALAGCDSLPVNFSDASVAYNDAIQSYQWDFGDNKTAAQQNPAHYYRKAGTKEVMLIIGTAAGCTDTAVKSIDVVIPEKPAVAITAPEAACAGAAVSFSASAGSQPVTGWQWTFGNGSKGSTQTAASTYTTANAYTVQLIATGSGQCADTALHTITINPLPAIDAGRDTVICAGSTAALHASGAASYAWTPASGLSCVNCGAPVVNPSRPAIYYVTGKSTAGCAATDSVAVNIVEKNMLTLAGAAPVICAGKTVQLNASGAYHYSWQPAAGLNDAAIANPVAAPAVTTAYTVTGTDSLHCFEDTKQLKISVVPAPVFNIIDTVFIAGLNGNKIVQTTNSPDIIRWQWVPAKGLNCYDCAEPQVQATTPAVYTATAYNAQGCSVSDKVRIEVLCNQSNIFIPSAFTPNGDGRNDRFYPLSSADTKVLSFLIYNKTGQLIFSKKDISTNTYRDGWDGMYKGFMLNAEIYIYRIEVLCDARVISFTGTVTLIR